jgi:molybdopterin-guanine dinucleotide biosynthesis protein A
MKHNKVFLKLRGEPLIKQVVQAASEVSKNIVVAIGMQDQEEDYTSILPKSVNIVKDTMDDKAAILGIITGLNTIRAEYAAVLAADLPFINPEVIKQLHREAENFDLAIPSWPNGNIEPLYAVYRVSAADRVFKDAVRAGAVRLRDAINKLERVNYVPVEKFRYADPSLHCFININTPEDLSAVKAILRDEDASTG